MLEVPAPPAPAAQVDGWSEELQSLRDELQSTIEELQTSNEEMKASHEEVTSINEELQSTNEELETSKEELQSLNEELTTVNAELQAKMEELERTSNDLSSLLSSTDIAVLFLDTQFRIRRYTAAMKQLLDVIATDVGRPLTDLARKFSDPDLSDDAATVLEKLTPIEKVVSSDDDRWYVRRVLPYRTVDNRIEGVVLIFVDVTERLRANSRLAETSRLLNLSNDAIIIRDAGNLITYWNHGAAELLGWSSEQAVGKDLSTLLRTEGELPLDELAAALRDKSSLSGQVVYTTRDGRRCTMLCRWAMDAAVAGKKSPSILTTATDVSDRQALEDQRAELFEVEQQARVDAEAANTAKDMFLANASHELRTPLSAIVLWATLLQTGRIDEATLKEGLLAIEHGAKSQQRIIDDLMDSARITAGKMRLELYSTDLAVTVKNAVDVVRPAAEAKGIDLSLDLGNDVGFVMADPDRLQQVVWNLLSNAVKFTPSGGHVQIAVLRQGPEVSIRVTDSGQGIDADTLPEIFARFRQADSSPTRRNGGLGLGLAICRQLVELHGGSIVAASEGAGKGSVFTVTLPLPRRASVIRRVPTKEGGTLAGVRVLLVEDDLPTREVLTLVLEKAGAIVKPVGHVDEAIAAIAGQRPMVILSDIGLPDRDGHAFLRQLRSDELNAPRLPAIALSAFDRPQDRARAIESGFDEYLPKPVQPAQLVGLIRKLLGMQ